MSKGLKTELKWSSMTMVHRVAIVTVLVIFIAILGMAIYSSAQDTSKATQKTESALDSSLESMDQAIEQLEEPSE